MAYFKRAEFWHRTRYGGVVSKNTNELKTNVPGRFGLEVSTLGSPMEARILDHEDAKKFEETS